VEEYEDKVEAAVIEAPCPSCGSKLSYDVERQQIACEYCGFGEDFNRANDLIAEQCLHQAVSAAASFKPAQLGRMVYHCSGCGSRIMIEPENVKTRCTFCGADKVNQEAYDRNFIQPAGIIPFIVTAEKGAEQFNQWIRRGWFHPNSLKKLAKMDGLHGIYLPFWTYNAQTTSRWRGEAGTYYYVTERVYVNGQWQTKQVRKVRWQWRSGNLNHFFKEVMVVGSKNLSQQFVERIFPYRTDELVNFDPRLILGWEAEVYNIEVDEGYQTADQIMDHQIRGMCAARLGGDTQRNLSIQSQKFDQTFKHVILPVYMSAYTYKGKVYHFLVNGQTGKVHGKKPLSWIKITLVVLLFIAIFAAIFILGELQ
jgi:DNA-directed RNA polymerase subunit RPC12/RpoP